MDSLLEEQVKKLLGKDVSVIMAQKGVVLTLRGEFSYSGQGYYKVKYIKDDASVVFHESTICAVLCKEEKICIGI